MLWFSSVYAIKKQQFAYSYINILHLECNVTKDKRAYHTVIYRGTPKQFCFTASNLVNTNVSVINVLSNQTDLKKRVQLNHWYHVQNYIAVYLWLTCHTYVVVVDCMTTFICLQEWWMCFECVYWQFVSVYLIKTTKT